MIIEACVENINEAHIAVKKGADRLELCSDLANDGLTPSVELLKKVCSEIHVPVMSMVRPRAGNFVYEPVEIEQMKNDIDNAKKAGAYGIVLGLLTKSNKIDVKNTSLLADYAFPLPVTFHKAIDELDDPVEGVKQLLRINGIKRILTSGGAATALEGQNKIREMMETTKGNITILVAGKVLNSNIEEVKKATLANEFHGRRIVGELI